MPMVMAHPMIRGAQCKNALEWAKEAVDRGAGELLVTSIDRAWHGA